MKYVAGKALCNIFKQHDFKLKITALSSYNGLWLSLPNNYSIFRVVFINKNEKIKSFIVL